MTKAKICYISPLSQHIYRWMGAFAAQEYEVSLITDSNCWMAPQIRFAPVYELSKLAKGKSAPFLLPNILKAIRTLKKIKPDFVHLHVQHYLSTAIMLSRLPYLLTSWGIEITTLQQTNMLFRQWARITAKKAKIVIVDARFLKGIWIENGVPRDKVRVIPFGVDTGVFHTGIDASAVRSKLRVDADDVVIISTRPFLNHHYDVERLIRAIPQIVKKHPNARFVIKGKGPLEHYLRNLARKLQVYDYARFVGVVPHSEVAQYLAAANIYVSTCAYDSTSASLLEAMACGLAPVVTNIVGNREWIKDGVNGFLFTPKNHESLAGKISQLIDDESMRLTFGKRCAELVSRNASWRESVSEMKAIYEMFV